MKPTIESILAGWIAPYRSYDKLELIENIRTWCPGAFTDDFFKIIDSTDFYSMCLNRVRRSVDTHCYEFLIDKLIK